MSSFCSTERPGAVAVVVEFGLKDSPVEVTCKKILKIFFRNSWNFFLKLKNFVLKLLKIFEILEKFTCCGLVDFRCCSNSRCFAFAFRFAWHCSSGITTKIRDRFKSERNRKCVQKCKKKKKKKKIVYEKVQNRKEKEKKKNGKKKSKRKKNKRRQGGKNLTLGPHSDSVAFCQTTSLTFSPHVHIDITVAAVFTEVSGAFGNRATEKA